MGEIEDKQGGHFMGSSGVGGPGAPLGPGAPFGPEGPEENEVNPPGVPVDPSKGEIPAKLLTILQDLKEELLKMLSENKQLAKGDKESFANELAPFKGKGTNPQLLDTIIKELHTNGADKTILSQINQFLK